MANSENNTAVEIPLTRGLVALIDSADYNRISQFSWRASPGVRPYPITTKWNGKSYDTFYLHRFLLGAEKGQEVDHKDGNVLNNTRANLRLCSHSQNLCNRKKRAYRRFKGPLYNKRLSKYESRICYQGKQYYLGVHETEEGAARAYDSKAKELYGEFAQLNFPES